MVIRAPGPAHTLRCETVPDPTPGPHEIVIQVAACGVCFHDVVVRNGILRRGIELPCVPGHEVAGTVVAIGPGARGVRVGDRVATTQRSFVCGQCRYCRSGREPLCDQARFLGDAGLNGGYAEFVSVDAGTVVPVPEGVPLEAAAIAACAIGTM
ncbi:MAG: alcohol dehydrogenase catalytic domain-containing protein, partial [Pseudomonadota bacterium]|nr:alcohol dehydrogenase catalytic domain-containing protein [Pseudomonadota bacterium]